MPGQRPILAMSFIASLGLTFQVLACTLPHGQGNFWPLLVIIFYITLPIPIMMSRKVIKDTALGMTGGSTGHVRDSALFFTAGIIVSSMALPMVLARSPTDKPIIAPISCILVEIGNALCYLTLGLFCIYFKPLDSI